MTTKKSKIYCCECVKKVDAVLINGAVAYPHRKDLKSLPFWQCPQCKNFVGCHHKTKNRTNPLGCIANKEMKFARHQLHMVIDPLWKYKGYSRTGIYKAISDKIGRRYHTAQLRTLEEAREVYRYVKARYYNEH